MRQKLGADHIVRNWSAAPFNRGDVLRRLADVRSHVKITGSKSLDAPNAMSALHAVAGGDYKINMVPSISNCEAAELTDKRHVDIMRDIRAIAPAQEKKRSITSYLYFKQLCWRERPGLPPVRAGQGHKPAPVAWLRASGPHEGGHPLAGSGGPAGGRRAPDDDPGPVPGPPTKQRRCHSPFPPLTPTSRHAEPAWIAYIPARNRLNNSPYCAAGISTNLFPWRTKNLPSKFEGSA
jgi:hypothetical protein